MATATATAEVAPTTVRGNKLGFTFLSLTRISIGFIFLWAFFDKLLGLGFSTCRTVAEDGSYTIQTLCEKAWVNGGHVTEGYLVYGGNPSSPFHDFYVSLGAQRWTDWIFMIGLLGIGAALMLGIGQKVALFATPAMLLMMYTTQMWPANNPILDDHIIQALAVIGIILVELTHQPIGLGTWWRKLGIVKKFNWLV